FYPKAMTRGRRVVSIRTFSEPSAKKQRPAKTDGRWFSFPSGSLLRALAPRSSPKPLGFAPRAKPSRSIFRRRARLRQRERHVGTAAAIPLLAPAAGNDHVLPAAGFVGRRRRKSSRGKFGLP